MTTITPLESFDFSPRESLDLELGIAPDRRQRRWTIAIRGLLIVPAYFALLGCGVVVVVTLPFVWVTAVILGRLPRWARKLYSGYLLTSTRLGSYAVFAHDQVPDLGWRVDEDFPVQLELPRERPLNRWSVAFRWPLAFPATAIAMFGFYGVLLLSIIVWVITLIGGRAPRLHREAALSLLRYYPRAAAYQHLLTSRWPSPRWLGGDQGKAQGRLFLSVGARILVAIYIVVGATSYGCIAFDQAAALKSVTSQLDTEPPAATAAMTIPTQPLPPVPVELSAAYDRALTARIPDTTRDRCTPTAQADLGFDQVAGRDCHLGDLAGAPEWLEYRSYPSPDALRTSFCQTSAALGADPCTTTPQDSAIARGRRITGGQTYSTVAWMDPAQSILITLDSTHMSPDQISDYQNSHEFLAH